MKTVSCFRQMLVAVAMITLVSCADPAELTGPGTSPTPSSKEFHSVIYSWNQSTNGDFISVLPNLSGIDFSKASVYALRGSDRILISGHAPMKFGNGDLSATIQGNVVVLTYRGDSGSSMPPATLDIYIVD